MPTDLNGKPFQLTFVRPAQMMLFANVVCYPPLGQPTVIRHDAGTGKNIKFHVMIESSISFPQQPWETVLWHNCNSSETWGGLTLQETTSPDTHLAISSSDRPKVYRRFFTGTLGLPEGSGDQRYFEFTFRYRTELSSPWRWANDNSKLGNGSIIFQTADLPTDLTSLFHSFGSAFTTQNIPSEASGTKLFYLTHGLQGAGQESTYQTDVLGIPKDYTRWASIGRLWTPWLAPQHGKDHFQLHLDGLEASFLRKDGIHLVLVAISAIKNVVTVIKSSEKGEVLIESRNDEPEAAMGAVLAAVGYDHAATLGACMYQARRIVGSITDSIAPQIGKSVSSEQVARLKEQELKVEKKVEADWYEEWQDSFTYCTWNGLGQDLTEAKILNALDDLAAHDIQIGNLIIDDNWQDLDNEGKNQMDRGWKRFDANKKGFPDGLKQTVDRIRQRQPQLHTVAVWHALLGYWGGISPEGELAKKYKIKKVARADIKTPGGWTHPGGSMHVIDEPDIQRMYIDFYDFLESAGINAVKTDAQFILDLMASPEDRRKYTKAYQDAWSISGLSHFGHRQISCMSLFPQNIFHNLLQMGKPQIMVRNSDDFFPEIPESHPWHIFTNAHTSRFTAFLNALPDWDMFQTSHPYSSFHAAARCISGGPIYFTDEPGKHDMDLIKQMTAKTVQGTTVILRPNVIGRVIESQDYVGYDEERALKIGAYFSHSSARASFLGVFNASKSAVTDFVMVQDFPSFTEDSLQVIIRAHTTGEVSLPTRDAPAASLYLPTKGWEILTAWLLHPVPGTNSVKVACFGLLGKMTGGAAVLSFGMRELENARTEMTATLKALGTLGVYVSDLDDKTVDDSFMVTIYGQPVPPETVKIGYYNVLEIDVAKAWEMMELQAGWSNEVTVKIIMAGKL